MSTRVVQLPGPAILVSSSRVTQRVATDLGVNLETVVADVARLAADGALPARLESGGATSRLLLYTQRHVVKLNPTENRDAYRLNFVGPLTFRDQEQLLAGALLLYCPDGWYSAADVNQIPNYLPRNWDQIAQEWQAMAKQPDTHRLPAAHAQYLDLLEEVVQVARDIEIERQRAVPSVPYRRRSTTLGQRYSVRSAYEFDLLQPTPFVPGTPIQVGEDSQLRGRVNFVEGRKVTVRFDTAVDYARIPAQGALQVLPSQAVARAQTRAIDELREGRSANPDLLANLVDHQMHPYQPNRRVVPPEPLDPAQREAFQAALSVPDQLLVLGPPGTGKTRVITAIAAASVERGERVLLTAYTNRALDNVLERLPGTMRVVRVGNEDAMTAQARGLMVESQVQTLRASILTATEGTVSRLAGFSGDQPSLARWNSFLSSQVDKAASSDLEAHQHAEAFDAACRRVTAPLAQAAAATQATARRAQAKVTRLDDDMGAVCRRLADAQRRSEKGPLSRLFRWQAGHRTKHVAKLTEKLHRARANLDQAEAAAAVIRAEAADLIEGSEEATTRRTARDNAIEIRDAALAEATRAGEIIQPALQLAAPIYDLQAAGLPATTGTMAEWDRYRQRLGEEVTLNCARAVIMAQWREAVSGANEELHRELVRLADVVAATCIGTATTSLLTGQEFDLALVDEAAQISTPNLLVPLIRARRSVLVGDHHQLPPYLDHEVKGRVDNLAQAGTVSQQQAREIGDLLHRSAFEQLFAGAPPSHRVMLTVQRRMPEPLARFVSQQFYDGALETAHHSARPDPLFGTPFALIDTSDRSARDRAEQARREGEEWGVGSVRNELEAALITNLITERVSLYRDWAVIVPYKAQVARLVQLLAQALGDADAAAANIGTVDAFQGGERDLIVYGFTRSNASGQIGFLKELRRINVAITRARQQLIMVGDLSTLRAANDPPFAELIHNLTEYLTTDGEIVRSRQILNHPRSLRPRETDGRPR